MHIILYQGGGCGNMVSAVIDSTGSLLLPTGHIVFDSKRRTLQQNFYVNQLTDEDRDRIILNDNFKSIHSHSFDYHIKRKHDFIFIDCDDPKYINWVCTRFNYIHEIQNKNKPEIKITPEYIKEITAKVTPHTNKIIPIRDILESRLIETLSKYVDTPLNVDIYNKWLDLMHLKFPLDVKNT
jgi:hypothetical protein